jgi:hypothetical protein
MSMRDVSVVYNELVRELSLNLALHEAAMQHAAETEHANAPYSGPDSQLQLQKMRTAFDRWGCVGDMHAILFASYCLPAYKRTGCSTCLRLKENAYSLLCWLIDSRMHSICSSRCWLQHTRQHGEMADLTL